MNLEACSPDIIQPTWSVAQTIQAISTTRKGGVSQPPWNTSNLATHVNDNLDDVLKNRNLLKQRYKLPSEPAWLEQVHSNDVVRLTAQNVDEYFKADAAYTTEKNIICCIMTADCLPILICNQQATWVAAVHAGWKGIANGILKETLRLYRNDIGGSLSDLQVWIGPAIGAQAYQVGEDVKQAYQQQDGILEQAFSKDKTGRYLLNNTLAAKLQLIENGLQTAQITTEDFCTYRDAQRFYSYRRDGVNTGRMASMIWLS